MDLPYSIREKMENVAIVIEDQPSDKALLGLYQGVPMTKRGPFYTLVLPDKITIFKSAIEAYGSTREEIIQIIKETVWHEIAHHFGFDEGQVQKLARRRKK